MEPQVFKRFQKLAYTHAGIDLKAGKEALVTARVRKRMRALGIGHHKEYLEYLEDDTTGEEMLSFLDVISTNFTKFFREAKHFEFLSRHLKELQARGQRRVRIWCAAASTGEEPYTLAMVCQDVLGKNADFKILATDISTSVIAKCKAATYPAAAVQNVPARYRHAAFHKSGLGDDAVYVVNDELRDKVVFKLLNLAHPPFPMTGPLDAIFCRNVMIYFDNPVRQRLVSAFEDLIRQDGLVVIGQSETLTGLTHGMQSLAPSVFAAPHGRSR